LIVPKSTAQSAPARCPWCGDDPLYVAYHDEEWGVPCHDDRKLFEFLILEGAQAGLSWITILRKRENYRRALDGFDVERIARYGEADIARLLADPGIVRNRLKITGAVANARSFLATCERFGSFDAYLWRFVDGQPRRNAWHALSEVPAETLESRTLSKDLLAQGYKFVGPTICYALMQAVGMIDDHLVSCHRHGAS
jgi:DNA-3-methyladenine glycosylase I